MNILVKWGVKKYVLKIVNTALDKYNVNVARARAIVAQYTAKVEALLAFLKSLDAKLADGKLDNDEADAIVTEATKLAEDLTA